MPELDTATGSTWRWIEEKADIDIESFGADVQLTIRGESPLRYFQEAPRVAIAAGRTELASFRPGADYEWTVTIPAAVLADADGRVTIQTNRSFVPNEVSGNGDQTRLALKIFSVSATALVATAAR